jgi:hypothetical protein
LLLQHAGTPAESAIVVVQSARREPSHSRLHVVEVQTGPGLLMRTLDRFADDEIATDDVPDAELRAFFAAWADDLDQPRPDTR